jgi:repressor LexA
VTATRARVLAAIRTLTAELGYAPSLREIGARAGLNLSTTAYHVGELAEAGAITRQPGIPRSIKITEEINVMSTPSDTLRAAAARIREVANKATNGRWSHEHEGGHIVHGPDGTIAEAEYGPDGAHIGLWNPLVAEAVAVWLDEEADSADEPSIYGAAGQAFVHDYPGSPSPALALARLILGEATA